MLLNPKSLKVVGAASTDAFQYSLNGILIEPDGSGVGCDGHILVKFTPSSQWDPKEFPSIEGCDPRDGATLKDCANHAEKDCVCDGSGKVPDIAAEHLKPFILDSKAAIDIGKAMPRRATLPILSNVAIDSVQTNANDHAVMAVTDLKNPRVFKPRKIDAQYPDYQKVIPEVSGLKVGFTLEVFEKLLKTLKSLNVTVFSIQFETSHPELGPARIEAETKDCDGRVLAVIMPCRLK